MPPIMPPLTPDVNGQPRTNVANYINVFIEYININGRYRTIVDTTINLNVKRVLRRTSTVTTSDRVTNYQDMPPKMPPNKLTTTDGRTIVAQRCGRMHPQRNTLACYSCFLPMFLPAMNKWAKERGLLSEAGTNWAAKLRDYPSDTFEGWQFEATHISISTIEKGSCLIACND